MTTQIDIPTAESTPEFIERLLATIASELHDGNAVTFTIAPPTAPAVPALFSVPTDDAETDVDHNMDEIPQLGDGILLRSAARLCLRWELGYLQVISDAQPTEADALQFLRERPDFAASCEFAARHTDRSLMNPTPIAVMHYGASRVNGVDHAEAYLKPLASGAGLIENDPRLTLRNKLQAHYRRQRSIVANENMLIMLVRNYNWHAQGIPVSKLRWPRDFSTPPIYRIAQ